MRIGQAEREYVMQVLDTQFQGSKSGGMTKRLEEMFAQTCEARYAISFVNGTATMHAALVAAGVGPGDEVIVPPLTMAATAFAVLHAGATPVFADIDPRTWLIDPESIRERLSSRTRAIIPVALYGLLPDMDTIMSIAEEHRLFVLEDDAQCFLATANGRIAGSIGHASSFSFQSSKHMTSGEGGMITTNDEDLAQKIRRFNSLGYAAVGAGAGKGKITKDVIQEPTYERHSSVGFNYRMPELCAAVALGQLERLSELVAQRTTVGKLFLEATANHPWLVPQAVPATHTNSYWTYVAKLDENCGVSWSDFRKKYLALGGDRFYGAWQLNYLEPAFQSPGLQALAPQPWSYRRGLCPVAESIQPRLLQLKTNYTDLEKAKQQAEILAQTAKEFE